MKKDLVEMVFILDRSGSMKGLEADTIGGFNSLVEKQKQQPGDAVISLVLFDDQFEVIHHRRVLKALEPLTSKEYYVRGSTALVDAIGRSIRKIRQIHLALGQDNIPEKTMFVITTDGQENASREFNNLQIKRMVEEFQEKYGWEFLFLGANIDSFSIAADLGILRSRTANFQANKEGINRHYEAVDETIRRFRNHDVNFMNSLDEHLGEDKPKPKKK
jgi:hypothetical protein